MSTIGELFGVIDLAGVLTNAILGGIVAREERMDPVGFVTLALLSGLGGGIIRDTLLQHGPPVALTDFRYVLCAVIGAVIGQAFDGTTGPLAAGYAVSAALALAIVFWTERGRLFKPA